VRTILGNNLKFGGLKQIQREPFRPTSSAGDWNWTTISPSFQKISCPRLASGGLHVKVPRKLQPYDTNLSCKQALVTQPYCLSLIPIILVPYCRLLGSTMRANCC
jgi:hypothetical protein